MRVLLTTSTGSNDETRVTRSRQQKRPVPHMGYRPSALDLTLPLPQDELVQLLRRLADSEKLPDAVATEKFASDFRIVCDAYSSA